MNSASQNVVAALSSDDYLNMNNNSFREVNKKYRYSFKFIYYLHNDILMHMNYMFERKSQIQLRKLLHKITLKASL